MLSDRPPCSVTPRARGVLHQLDGVGRATGAFIEAWEPPCLAPSVHWRELLPPGRQVVPPTCVAQERQRKRVAGLRIGRVPQQPSRPLTFQVGKMEEAVAQWRAVEPRARRQALPPVEVLRAQGIATDDVFPTLIAHPHSHPWYSDGPMDVHSCAALMALDGAHAPLQAAQGEVTPTQLRSMLFQGVHGRSADVVIDRTGERLGAGGWSALSSFASVGAVLDTLGARLVRRGVLSTCDWWADSNPAVQRAHVAYWSQMGQHPRLLERVDDWELQQRLPRTDVENITLRCAPFSPKHRKFPKGCWAAVRELRIALAGTARRKPRVVIYENTAGLWQRRAHKWRRRVERLLRGLKGYCWEAIRTSPHRHSGCPVRRERVFYVGIL